MTKPQQQAVEQGIEYRIQFGTTDGFQYIGVQPPLPYVDLKHFRSAVEDILKDDYCFVTSGFTRRPEKGEPYTEIGVMGSPDIEQLTLAAKGAMDTVTYSNDRYEVSQKVRGIGWGKYLFGGKDATRLA